MTQFTFGQFLMCSNFSLAKLGKMHFVETFGQALINRYFDALFSMKLWQCPPPSCWPFPLLALILPVNLLTGARVCRLSLSSVRDDNCQVDRGRGVRESGGRRCNKTIFFGILFFPSEISKHSTGFVRSPARVAQEKLI